MPRRPRAPSADDADRTPRASIVAIAALGLISPAAAARDLAAFRRALAAGVRRSLTRSP